MKELGLLAALAVGLTGSKPPRSARSLMCSNPPGTRAKNRARRKAERKRRGK